MKISFLLLVLSVLNAYGTRIFSQNAIIYVDMQNATIREIVREIERQGEIKFLFNDNLAGLNTSVDVSFTDHPIKNVLTSALGQVDLMYEEIKEDFLVLLPKPVDAQQQQLERRGRVTDDNGDPLPGVSIIIVGTNTGTATDIDGNYSINIPNDQVNLSFSFVGYETRTIPAGTQPVLNVVLEEALIMIEENVVTALGMKRDVRAISYSATEVGGDDLASVPDINIMNALEGMVAGVFITNPGTGPAGQARVTIRGSNSIARSSQPLYVVDGVPISRSGQSERGRDLGDVLTHMNPNVIESMNVLKGAAATALYGSRASNGVVLITTKSALDHEGVQVSFNSSVGFDHYINPLNGRQTEYGVSGSMGDNSDIFPLGWNEETHRAWGRKYDGTNIGEENGIYFNDDPTKPIIWSFVTDHWDTFMDSGLQFNNSLSISGGGPVQRYRVSVSDMRYDTPIPNSNMNRQIISMNTNSRIKDIITIDGRLNYSVSNSLNRPVPSRYHQYLSMIPTNWPTEWLIGDPDKPGANPDGWMLSASTNDYHPNPYWSAYQDEQTDRRDQISASANVRVDFTDWLFLIGRMGAEMSSIKNTDISAYGWRRSNIAGTGRVDENTTIRTQQNYEGALNFDRNFGLFNVIAMVGGSITRNEYNRDGISGNRLEIPFYHVITNAANLSTSVGYSQSGINSLYGSAELSYNSMVYLTLTGRNDWFSMLAPGYNSIFYPSIGLSYVFSNQFDLPDWITFGKLRGSYAEVGGGAGTYDTKIGYNFDAIGYMDSPLVSVPGTIANPMLQPYLTSEYEVGLDIRFFRNRIGIDYSYYDTETVNDIVSITLPSSSGYTGSRVNLGAMANKGHELMLTLIPIAAPVRLQMNLSYAYNISEVLDLGGPESINVSSTGNGGGLNIRHVVGQPRNAIYGHKHMTTDDGQLIWQRMTFGYQDQTHYTWRPVRSPDRELLGYGENNNSASVRASLTWNNFSLSALVDGRWGGKVAYMGEQNMVERGQSVQTLPGRAEGKLVLEGVYQPDPDGPYVDISEAPGYTINANPERNLPNPVPVAGNEIPYHIKHFEQFYRHYGTRWLPDFILQDASYAKFRQLTLGYDLPQSALANLPMQDVNVSVTGRNLFDLYNNLVSGDPSTGGAGFNWHAFPALRQFTINLKVNF